jgi:DNA-binding SARP family transcriptional activator
MYRLREALKSFSDKEYIITLPGAYQWNPEILVNADYEYFEDLADQIRWQKDEWQKVNLCRKAIACFNGQISPKLSGETWVISMMTRYRSMYMDIVKTLSVILEKEGLWSELEAICNTALDYDQMDEDLHYWIIESLTHQKKYELAMQHYEKISLQLYGELGIHSTERMQSIFREMLSDRGGDRVQIGDLKRELNEQAPPTGVFLCDYQAFRQIYRMEARRMDRTGMAEFLVILTVRRNGGIVREPANDSTLLEGMDILRNVICRSLRTGDVVAQYNLTQFIMLLPTCSEEACEKVIERLRRRFTKDIKNRRLELLYELEEVELLA